MLFAFGRVRRPCSYCYNVEGLPPVLGLEDKRRRRRAPLDHMC